MTDYDLYYWPVPFRGQFIRAILAFAGKSWREHDSARIGELMGRAPADQPIPFMGPPMLIDRAEEFAIAEMPAIALYLGETLNLLPASAQGRALAMKVVNDANDVIDEITLDGGREMWTADKWREFVPRLERWMAIWEATGTAHGLTEESGTLLGTEQTGLADIVTAVLWSTMAERLPAIAAMLDRQAPCVSALAARISDIPELAKLAREAAVTYGDAYCGGEIGKSLRKVAG